jgi:hypothetical protein
LDCPLGQVPARRAAASGRSAPGTAARAALALGATEIGRVEPPTLRGAIEPAGAPAGPAGVLGAEADPAELVGAAADPELVGVAAGGAHRAPGAGAGGNSYGPSSCGSASLAGVRAAFGVTPALSGVACCSSMSPPDRRGSMSVATSGAGPYRAISARVPASGASLARMKIRRVG